MERSAHEAPAGGGPPDGYAIGGDDVMACGKQKPGACAWAAFAEIAVRFLIPTPPHDTHTRSRGTIG